MGGLLEWKRLVELQGFLAATRLLVQQPLELGYLGISE
jgi:hypothetical protein